MNDLCLGIDWGTKRIGLALGSAETKIASPLGFVESLDGLLDVAKNEKIDRFVLGIPSQASNSDREVNSDFRAFLKALEADSSLPISKIDERFSSQLADRLMTTHKRDGSRDAIAAMVILQAYFDSLK